ncbi:MAG: histone deacetylase [Actinomycetes bacterium]
MLLVVADPVFEDHDAGPHHPERPARHGAVRAGIEAAGLVEARRPLEVAPAPREALLRVHPAHHLDRLAALDAAGGGRCDPDTALGPDSWSTALLAAGAGLAAVEALDAGHGRSAFLAIRPPGHHATADQSMGFCLLNNVAITAAAIADRGERVVVVDYDAHHGNGTQDIFAADPRVLYVSFHEWPLYPGTGRHDEVGSGPGEGTTLNVPLPAGATGEHYLAALDRIVAPVVAAFDPHWVLVSAGFDAHRADPLTGLALSAGDYPLITERVLALAPPGRSVVFLEGGYDLDALRDSVAATLPVLVGERPTRAAEAPTRGGPGGRMVEVVEEFWRDRRGG